MLNYKKEKDFGYTFFFIFLILSFLSFFYFDSKFLYQFISISLFLIILTLIKPRSLRIPSILWLEFAILISKITNPIINLVIFVLLFCTFGIMLRILNIDLLNQKIQKNKKSYWELKSIKTSFEQQF
jgi:hypothetical protein